MLSRRTTLRASATGTAGLVAAAHAAAPAAAQMSADLLKQFGFRGPEDSPEFGPPRPGVQVGPGLSRHDEVRRAFRILLDVPRRQGQLAAATYFQKLTAKNANGESYAAEWRARANPVIVGFFSMTNTTPSEGDQTHWCAAFVSFCLYAANKPNKFDALSGAYRTYAEATNNPVPGDIAVFSKYGEEGAKGKGHVGFFLRREARNGKDGVVLLGGNQAGDTGTTGAVTESWYALQGDTLQHHSFRRVPSEMLPDDA